MNPALTRLRQTDQAEISNDLARVILKKLDPPRKKSEMPVKPIVTEFFGLPKSGKDTQLVELDRWFRRRGYQVLVHQESAETEEIRTSSRDNPYVYEMRHFAYTFSNFIGALTSRDFHLIALNRGPIDTLCWLEWHRRKGTMTDSQFEQFRSYILGGPWVDGLDGVFYLTCSVPVALQREYGNTANPVYGSRMNPEALTLMKECIDSVFEDVQARLPRLPMFMIDTSDKPVSEVREEIIASLLDSARTRLEVPDEDVIAFSPAMLRDLAQDAKRQEVKFSGTVSTNTLLGNSWHPESVSHEMDIYLTPKSQSALENDECFHIRRYDDRHCYLIYKRRGGSPTRSRVSVPVSPDSLADFFTVFDKVAVIEKEREIFVKNGIVLARDKVEGLGEFTEMRAPVSVDIVAEAERLGLTTDRMVPETYIRMFLKNQSR